MPDRWRHLLELERIAPWLAAEVEAGRAAPALGVLNALIETEVDDELIRWASQARRLVLGAMERRQV